VNYFSQTENKPLISVIVVNWNGKEVIKECLESLRNQTFRDFEVIVVDNGSTDGSVELIKALFPEVILIELPVNRGFSAGNNVGLKIARGDFIALLNNDAVAENTWLENLLKATKINPQAGMWASKVLQYFNHNIIDNTGLLIYKDGLARGRGRLEVDNFQYDRDSSCLIPSGCAALFRREAIEDGFDERFFAYADDVDVGLRARFMGWDCVYVPEAKVYHRYSYSTSPYSKMKAFLTERNRIWILVKYFPLNMLLVSPFYTIWRYLFHLFGFFTKRGASGQIRREVSFLTLVGITIKAWCSALKGLTWCLKERFNIYSKKKISWVEIKRLINRFSLSVREITLKE
jgi:GT2 family glycosyltransferase